MATTNGREDQDAKVEAVRYAESDKLGPLGTKRSILDDEAELRRTLVAEFQATADAARDAAGAVDANPTTAVHDYRKALRRARAVLALVTHALPRSERRALLRALRESRRALSAARDQAVVPQTLSAVELDEVDRATAGSILSATDDSVPSTAEIKQLLAEGAARTAAQVEALEASLPQTLAWSTVERGVRDTYAAARRARKAGKRSKRAFHTWRRRSKELTYQLELLAGYAGARTAELHRELEHVTDTQGPAVDLLMLRDLVRTHATGIAPEAIERLSTTLDTQLDDLVADSRRAGREMFKRKPRRFARRVTKLVRRDATPVTVPDDVD
ncbi:MAG TPA: CHAD domain-containing protein [Kofleriaceae bacterium]